MKWSGINRKLTPLAEDPGISEYQQNTRMLVDGELQCRPGMAAANFSPATNAGVVGMVGAYPTSGPYGVTVDNGGNISGFPITGPIWEPPKLKPPIPNFTGGPWTLTYFAGVGTGDIEASPAGKCQGSIQVDTGATAAGVMSFNVVRKAANGARLLIEAHPVVTNFTHYNIIVPGNTTFYRVIVEITNTDAGNSFVGASDPGC